MQCTKEDFRRKFPATINWLTMSRPCTGRGNWKLILRSTLTPTAARTMGGKSIRGVRTDFVLDKLSDGWGVDSLCGRRQESSLELRMNDGGSIINYVYSII